MGFASLSYEKKAHKKDSSQDEIFSQTTERSAMHSQQSHPRGSTEAACRAQHLLQQQAGSKQHTMGRWQGEGGKESLRATSRKLQYHNCHMQQGPAKLYSCVS